MNNVGTLDRFIRIVVAIVFIVLGFANPWWFIVAAIALVTALVGWCPVYALFGWSTAKPAAKTAPKKAARKQKSRKK